MTTPTDDEKRNCADQKEPGEKGGVAGTDSKDLNSGGPFQRETEPESD